MKIILKALIILVGFIPFATHAQVLDDKETEQLVNSIKRDYMKTQAEGAKVYKLSKKKHVLSVCVTVNSSQNISQQNRVGQMKAARLASEFIDGARISQHPYMKQIPRHLQTSIKIKQTRPIQWTQTLLRNKTTT